MDTELKKLLQEIILLLTEIESNTDRVSAIEEETEKIRKILETKN